ncbi:hypothetical protein H1C71_015094 [Ictidomys tridecemlineatus]|nr:hypothetical protein H1C71_015094 [Ictidomys tridecemlineatus]
MTHSDSKAQLRGTEWPGSTTALSPGTSVPGREELRSWWARQAAPHAAPWRKAEGPRLAAGRLGEGSLLEGLTAGSEVKRRELGQGTQEQRGSHQRHPAGLGGGGQKGPTNHWKQEQSPRSALDTRPQTQEAPAKGRASWKVETPAL